MDKITANQIAATLRINYRKVLPMLAAGIIPARKSNGTNGRWVVLASDFAAFTKRNTAKLRVRGKLAVLLRNQYNSLKLRPQSFNVVLHQQSAVRRF